VQANNTADPDVDSDVLALEALTRVLVGIAWNSAHAAPPGVTFPQMRLLLVLEGLGRVSCSRLASALGVNASSVTRLADKLEAHGYLVRSADEHKRSVVTVEVTEAGRKVVAQVLDHRHAALGAVLDRMPEQARQLTATAAREFVDAAAGVPTVDASGPGPL
jgi:DNA-binding MarR family transcriptional regulator